MSLLKICKNPKCSNVVPTSKNRAIERLYCSYRCAHLVAATAYYHRERERLRERYAREIEREVKLIRHERENAGAQEAGAR